MAQSRFRDHLRLAPLPWPNPGGTLVQGDREYVLQRSIFFLTDGQSRTQLTLT